MNIEELYHFCSRPCPASAFWSVAVVCFILERKTRKQFKNHEKTEDDWSLFDDDEDESE